MMVNHTWCFWAGKFLELADRPGPPIMYRPICSRSTLSKVGASVKAFGLVYWILLDIIVHIVYCVWSESLFKYNFKTLQFFIEHTISIQAWPMCRLSVVSSFGDPFHKGPTSLQRRWVFHPDEQMHLCCGKTSCTSSSKRTQLRGIS